MSFTNDTKPCGFPGPLSPSSSLLPIALALKRQRGGGDLNLEKDVGFSSVLPLICCVL